MYYLTLDVEARGRSHRNHGLMSIGAYVVSDDPLFKPIHRRWDIAPLGHQFVEPPDLELQCLLMGQILKVPFVIGHRIIPFLNTSSPPGGSTSSPSRARRGREDKR